MNSVFKRSLLLSLAFFSMCSALIEPADPFNAIEDARSLREALTGHDPLNDAESFPLAITDSRAEVITDILTRRSGAQRVAIAEAYNSTYSSTLVEDFQAHLGGDFKDLMVIMATPLAEYYFNELWYDSHPFLPGSRAAVDILTTTPNAVLVAVADEGAKYYPNKRYLPAVVDTMYQGLSFQMIHGALAGTRPDTQEVDVDAAIADAKYLNEYGRNSDGWHRTWEEEHHIDYIFVSRSYKQLRQVFEEYTKLFGHDIEKAIEGRGLHSDLETGILNLIPIIKSIPNYLATRLHDALDGIGTFDRVLMRIIVGRSEIDLDDIRNAFWKLYGVTLGSMIEDDTSGEYKRALLAIVGTKNREE